MRNAINAFFKAPAYAVVGVSANRRKFGNAAYRAMKEHGLRVFPVNPKLETVEGDACFRSLRDLPEDVTSVVTVVPPSATELVVKECTERGITAVWMQPGSQSPAAIASAERARMAVVHGECIMMFLEPVQSFHAFHRFVKKLFGSYPR